MNYYERYLGDYGKKTSRLTLAQHGAYTLLLDAYYSEEAPLPADYDELYRMCRAMTKEEKDAVRKVADTFFPVASDNHRHNERADEEIIKAQAKINASKENGKRGGRPRKTNPTDNPKITQEKPGGFSEQNPAETHAGVHHAPTPCSSISEQASAAAIGSVSSNAASPPARFFRFIELLSKLEAERGKAFPAVATTDKRLAAWCEAGVTDDQLVEAHRLAVADRVANGDQQAVNIGFMDVFVGKILNPKGAESAVTTVAKPKRKCCWFGPNGEVCDEEPRGEVLGRWHCHKHLDFAMDSSNFRKVAA